MQTRTLANGETWEFREYGFDPRWHMVNADPETYSAITDANFYWYAQTIDAGALRDMRIHLRTEHDTVTDWASKYAPGTALAMLGVIHAREHGQTGSLGVTS